MDQSEIRINRVVGQLKGIAKMIAENRSSTQILQQISAVKKAIDGLTKEIVVRDIGQVTGTADTARIAELIEQAIRL